MTVPTIVKDDIDKKIICYEILQGLAFLHKNYIFHRVKFLLTFRISSLKTSLSAEMAKLKSLILVSPNSLVVHMENIHLIHARSNTELLSYSLKLIITPKNVIFGH